MIIKNPSDYDKAQCEKKEMEQLHRLTKCAAFDWIIWQFYAELLQAPKLCEELWAVFPFASLHIVKWLHNLCVILLP